MSESQRDPYFSSAHDAKSLTMNMASLVAFFLPIGCYFYPSYIKIMLVAVVIWQLAGFLVPPVGFLRPHPYSDIPSNRSKKAS